MDFPGALRTRASTGGITKETRRSVGPPPDKMKRKRAPRLLCTCVRCRTGKIKCKRYRRKEVEERATRGYSLGGSGIMLQVCSPRPRSPFNLPLSAHALFVFSCRSGTGGRVEPGGGSWASTPLMQLVVDRGDPLALKSLYMRAFCQLEDEGKVLREKALDML
ncbi:hypothetical protein NSK_006355 [Nannochloropsis salina CCMP1776]|uniref:Uncharacterized protein n=1 Tax=Nannochloropsis salina CCMP1776 TaxID=1027361 RepID=A0A4D9CW47_9STRA|nr:hypothetical protein NSK_006355 [Nannochloropsis salina CCMP1776]|eukprot:TFJ82327.1 hypothetical protein NSK_006355 [Nannochloropsis salina CCMP1776]